MPDDTPRKHILKFAPSHPFYKWFRMSKEYALGRAWHYWFEEDYQCAFEYFWPDPMAGNENEAMSEFEEAIDRILATGMWEIEIHISPVSQLTAVTLRSPNRLYKFSAKNASRLRAIIDAEEKANE